MSIFDIFSKTKPPVIQDAPLDNNTQSESESTNRKSSNDMLIDSVKRFRDEFREISKKASEENDATTSDAKKKIEAADRLVSETGLDNALLTLLKEMWHWPSWSQREDFSEYKYLDVNLINAEEDKTEKEDLKRIKFEYSGNEYLFEFIEDRSYFDGTKWGRIILTIGDHQLISLRVYHDLDRHGEYDDWSKLSVDGLQPGEWITHIIEMELKTKQSREDYYAKLERDRIIEQAKGLPDTD